MTLDEMKDLKLDILYQELENKMKTQQIVMKKLVTILLKPMFGESFDKEDYENSLLLAEEYISLISGETIVESFLGSLIGSDEENFVSVMENTEEFLWDDAKNDPKLADLITEILGIDFPSNSEDE